MKTCKICGIRYQTQDGNCPLCNKQNINQQLPDKKAFTRELFWKLFSIFSLAALLIIMVIDLVYAAGITWAKIPLLAISFLWTTLFLIKKTGLKSIVSLSLQTAATALTLALIDCFAGGRSWFLELGLPVLITLLILAAISIVLERNSKLRFLQKTALNVFFVGVFLLVLDALLKQYHLGSFKLSWSLLAFAGIIPLSIVFLYFDHKIKQSGDELKKYFHI